MFKVSFLYGMISAGIAAIIFLLIYLVMGDITIENYRLREYLGYAAIFLALSIVFFGIKSYRDKDLEGTINFSKAFGTGSLISAFSALGFGLFIVLLMGVIDREITNKFYDVYREMINNQNISEEMKAGQLQQMEAMRPLIFNPVWQGMIMFFTVFVIGIIISIASSLALRNNPSKA